MLAKLRWTMDYERSLEPLDYQQPTRYLNSHGISSGLPENGYYGPYDRHLNRKVVMFVSRVNSISSSDYLQVPSSWPVSRYQCRKLTLFNEPVVGIRGCSLE